MKNKLLIVLLCILSCNALYSQEQKPVNVMDALTWKTGLTKISLQEVDFVDIYGLIIDKEKSNELFAKDQESKANSIYDLLYFDYRSYKGDNLFSYKLNKRVLVLFNNKKLSWKTKWKTGLASIDKDKVDISFLSREEGKSKYGKKGRYGVIVISDRTDQ